MSKYEMLAKIELLNKYEAMMEELKAEADSDAAGKPIFKIIRRIKQ